MSRHRRCAIELPIISKEIMRNMLVIGISGLVASLINRLICLASKENRLGGCDSNLFNALLYGDEVANKLYTISPSHDPRYNTCQPSLYYLKSISFKNS